MSLFALFMKHLSKKNGYKINQVKYSQYSYYQTLTLKHVRHANFFLKTLLTGGKGVAKESTAELFGN
jgi:hypothetical protein